MKLIGLKEHFATPGMVSAWLDLPSELRDFAISRSTGNKKEKLLTDLGDALLAALDETGIDVQVMSPTSPGVQTLEPEKAVLLASDANDVLAAVVRHRPDRFQGFATLPFPFLLTKANGAGRFLEESGLSSSDQDRVAFGNVPAPSILIGQTARIEASGTFVITFATKVHGAICISLTCCTGASITSR